ncbi:hypothetical protein [Clostridium senegalense]|uniref:hypothetical protein n=1 Tax=Clostridium senegalense TaxID=1465809 RepID=UPI00028A023C|nr:hypothetical protein [Clostridium senegalense]
MKRKSELLQKEKSFDDKIKQSIIIKKNILIESSKWVTSSYSTAFPYEFKYTMSTPNQINSNSVVDVNVDLGYLTQASPLAPSTLSRDDNYFLMFAKEIPQNFYVTIKIINEVI